jgi:hypothetical protein
MADKGKSFGRFMLMQLQWMVARPARGYEARVTIP